VRVLRWVLAIAAALVLLTVAAVLIAALVVNPDHYRGEIESAVRRETGRPFVLTGNLRLTWFPWLGMRMGAARLGAVPGAGGPDLLQWQAAAVRVRLLPLLLHRRLEVGRIRIEGAELHLRRGLHGRGNWEDLLARLQSGGAATPAGTSSRAATVVALGGLDLTNATLGYLDEATGEHVRLTGWQLRLGPYRPGAPLSVRTIFVLHAANALARGSAASAGLPILPAAGVPVRLDVPRLQLQTTPLEVAMPRWSLRIADAKLRGALHAGRDASGQLAASGSLAAAVPSLRQLAAALGIGLPAVKDPAALAALSLAASWSYRHGALELEPLTARLDSTTLTGWVARSGGAKAPWRFALQANEVDFGRYLTRSRARKPLRLPVSALRALRAEGTIEIARAQIAGTSLKDVRLQVH
jgi:AsmA protein